MHPVLLTLPELLAECEISTGRRGGPGGQHRNKVETAVVVTHLPSGIRAEANERRSQAANRTVAIFRLRLKLAVELHDQAYQESIDDHSPSPLWLSRISSHGRISIADDHEDLPVMIAEALEQLSLADWNPTLAAERLKVTASQLVKLLRCYPPALNKLTNERSQRGLKPLR